MPPPGKTIRVLLDGRKLGDGGIGVYIQNLVQGLLCDSSIELTLIVAGDKVIPAEWEAAIKILRDETGLYSVAEYFQLARRVNSRRYHVFHSPHYTLPFRLGVPSVVTVHDLIHIRHPERAWYPFVAWPLMRSALSRASRIIAVSKATRMEIAELVSGASGIMDRVRVVPNAIDPYFLETPVEAGYLSNNLRLKDPYFLALLSLLKPHKGPGDLLKAWRLFMDRMPSRVGKPKLVLAGQGARHLAEHPELLREVGDLDSVMVLGAVTKKDLLHLYRGAISLVVPSTAEGFCLPVLESKAVGTPVLVRPVPAVLELVSDGDVVCKSFSVEALADGFVESISRAGMKTGMLTRVMDPCLRERFGVIETAARVAEVYHEAAQSV